MKTKSLQPAGLLCLLLFVAAPGCLEIKIGTTVNADGSCERTVSANPGSRELPQTAFPLPQDSSWTVTWEKNKDDRGYRYAARKLFPDAEALAREYGSVPADPGKIRITPVVERRFRWFFTYVTYRETYHVFNPFTRVPASDMLSEDEIRRIGEGEKNDTLKNKLEEWQGRNLFEGFYAAFLQGVRGLGDPGLAPGTVEARKEELYHALMNDSTATDAFDSTMGALSRFFRTPAVFSLRSQMRTAWDAAEATLKTAQTANADYANSVTMPGLILDTNAKEVQGATVLWKFSASQFLLRDYAMWVESRQMNLWAVVLTGVLAVAMLGIVVFTSLRRRSVV